MTRILSSAPSVKAWQVREGYCVSNHPQLDFIRYASRPYIFTASPCPSVIASTRQALKRVENGADLRARLWRHARRLYRHLLDAGL